MPIDLEQQTAQAPAPSAPDNSTPPPQPQAATPDASTAPVQPTQPQPNQPSQQAQPSSQPGAVSNAPAPNASAHPSVQRASILHEVATALAGGPRFVATPNPDGTVTRTRVPLSKSDIGMAIAMEAISGSLAGLAQKGPGAKGAAAEAGFQQVAQQRQQAQQQQEAQAQQDAKNKSESLVRQAQAYEQNSRVILNTAQAERYGVDSLKDAVQQNSQLLSDYEDAGAVQERNISQDALSAGLANKTYDATKQIAIPDGFTTINGKFEQTFALVSDPRAKVPLTQETAQALGDAGVQGYLAFAGGKNKIPDGTKVPGTMIGIANQQLQANNLMKQEYNGVVDALQNSSDKGNQALAKSIPSVQSLLTDPNNGPVFQNALSKFQRYVSHSDMHGMDFYESLQQMAAPSKPNPQNPKQFIPNPDATAAQIIAGAFGNGHPQKGWAILQAYHSETVSTAIKSEADATNILADPDSSVKQISQAKRYLSISQQTKANEAGAEARAKKAASGSEDATAGNPALIESNPVGGVNQKYLNSLPAGQRAIVQAIGEGRQEGPNTRTKEGRALSEVVNNAYPDYDGTRYHTYQAMQKDFVSGKTSQGLVALNTALSHLQILYDNANLGSTLPGVAGIERIAGNSSAVALKNAQVAVSDELGKAYKSGVVTESERKDWMNQLSGWTPANVRQSAVAFAHLLDGKISAYEQTLRNGAPSGAVKLPALMSPEAGAAYTHITGEAPTTTVGTRSIQSQPPVAGAIAGRDATGRIVAWKLPDGTVQRVQ
jgi:hypothetical protein